MVPLFGVYPSAFGDDEIYIAPPSFKLFSMESAEGEKSFLRHDARWKLLRENYGGFSYTTMVTVSAILKRNLTSIFMN
jgi:hypothetical protein